MATSQNGWPVLSGYSDPKLTRTPFITGKVLSGDVEWILNDFVEWFHKNVEALDKGIADDWGFAPRPIKGTSVISNHASGTAIDLNAVRYPMFRDNMDAAKEAKIRARLRRYSGAIRWGGDYRTGRIDQMHFEINVSPARLRTIVAALKGGIIPAGSKPIVKPSGKPAAKVAKQTAKNPPNGSTTFPTDYDDLAADGQFKDFSVGALQILMRAIGRRNNQRWDGDLGKRGWKDVQEWLKGLHYYDRAIDGDPGEHTIKALQRFLADRGFLDLSKWLLDGRFQTETKKAFQRYLNTQN